MAPPRMPTALKTWFVAKEVAGEALDLGREGGGEHEGLATVLLGGHALGAHDLADLGLEALVEHPVGLVEYDEGELVHGDHAVLDESLETVEESPTRMAQPRAMSWMW